MIETTSKARLQRAEDRAELLRTALHEAAAHLGVKNAEDWSDGKLCFAVLYRASRFGYLTMRQRAYLADVLGVGAGG